MSVNFGDVCDDFYVSLRLFLKLDLSPQRETLLHFFDSLRKAYPGLCRMQRRDNGTVLIEEEPDESGSRRWVRIDHDSLRCGHFAPSDSESLRRFCNLIVTQAPYHLTFSDIDYDHLELIYGFDLEYRGNHDQLVAETLWGDRGLGGFLFGDETCHVIDAQPYFGIALSPECDLQAYGEVKSRTSTYEVRNESYDPQPISVFLTLRKYWGVQTPASLPEATSVLFDHADRLARDVIIPNLVNPLAAAIASRP
jgi:hypothetical protein